MLIPRKMRDSHPTNLRPSRTKINLVPEDSARAMPPLDSGNINQPQQAAFNAGVSNEPAVLKYQPVQATSGNAPADRVHRTRNRSAQSRLPTTVTSIQKDLIV
ncbi:MAG: hypothetical protein ACR2OA_12645 [Rubripirellula sp.]